MKRFLVHAVDVALTGLLFGSTLMFVHRQWGIVPTLFVVGLGEAGIAARLTRHEEKTEKVTP